MDARARLTAGGTGRPAVVLGMLRAASLRALM
jgi:hypothetical protein